MVAPNVMKVFCLFILIALMPTNAFCLTRASAVQLSKSRIAGLLPRFATLAYNCFLFAEDCQIQGNSQEATLKWISSEMAKGDPEVSFDSGADKFTIDGAIRIAKTGKTWGSSVIFNEDLLAQEVAPGQFEAIGFFELIGVLVHEFGHHQEASLIGFGLKALEHHELDLIGAHVVAYLKDRTRRIQLGPEEIPGLKEEDRVNILQIDIEWNNGVRNQWSNIFVDSLAETREISQQLVMGLKCPKVFDHGHLTFKGEANYAAFRKVRAPKIVASPGRIELEQDVGEASVFCVDPEMGVFEVFDGYKNGKLRFVLEKNTSGQYLLNSGESTFRADPPSDQGFRD